MEIMIEYVQKIFTVNTDWSLLHRLISLPVTIHENCFFLINIANYNK